MKDKNTEEEYESTQLDDFLQRTSSSSSTPGGGATSALLGALSAALISMVASLSKNNESVSDFEEVKEEAVEKMERLVGLMSEDSQAFRQVMKAYKMPKDTEKEKKERKRKIQKALKSAIEPPLKTAQISYRLLGLCKTAVEYGNRSAITDGGAAAMYADAAVRSALLNVDINLAELEDQSYVEEMEKRRTELEKSASEESEVIVNIMRNRLEG